MPEHTGKENQAIENPPMELDSLPCYYSARQKGESVHANTKVRELWQTFGPPACECVGEKAIQSGLCQEEALWEQHVDGKSAFLSFLAVNMFCEEEKSILFISWMCFLSLLWVKESRAICSGINRSVCVQSAVVKWRFQRDDSRGSRDIPCISLC